MWHTFYNGFDDVTVDENVKCSAWKDEDSVNTNVESKNSNSDSNTEEDVREGSVHIPVTDIT